MKVNTSVNQTNYAGLKKFCQSQGADLFGIADISKIKDEFLLSQKILSRLGWAVCLGVELSAGILEEIECAPSKLYFHHYRTVNAFLDQLALRVAKYIQKKGYLALPIPASQIVDWQNQKAHLSHRRIGYLAGLGWIGRNNLLVNERLGSRFRMVSILTDIPLKTDKPGKKDCGACRLCVTICPASAIKENPRDFDQMKCFEKLKEFQKQRLVDQYICGVCLKVCRPKK
jgi:epoxyqueuosine reductase QueG